MSSKQLMTQVRLEKKISDTTIKYQVSWIPIEFAKTGKVLKLKNLITGEWSDGWVVSQGGTGGMVRTASECNDRANDYKRHRKATDI